MHYVITAYRPAGISTHKARSEAAALKVMDRLYEDDVRYDGVDATGRSIDENTLTDIIDAQSFARRMERLTANW